MDAFKNKLIKEFGVAPVENKVASTTPTFPIVESNTTAEDESVKLPTVPVTLDAKIASPIADDDSLGGGSEIERVVEINKSSSNLTKPLSLIASLKDSEVTEVTSDGAENAELTMKENKLTDPTVQFGEVYFVLGGPGSGKGTQCARIVEKFGFAHLSTGDLFRAEAEKGTELGQKISNIMKEGGLVSSDITVSLLKAAMLERDGANVFLIDGFPREMEQAKIFEENVCPCTKVLFFKCSDKVMVGRLKQRGLTSGRSDDNEETIHKRLKTFHEHTIPVISYYEQNNKVWEVNAESTVDEVFSKVEELFNNHFQGN